MSTALLLPVACPTCGGPVEPVTNVPLIRDATGAGTETKIGLRCTASPRHGDFVVVATLCRIRSERADAPCGTVAGYERHRARRESPCVGCAEAHRRHANPEDRRAVGPPSWEAKAVAARRQREELLSHV